MDSNISRQNLSKKNLLDSLLRLHSLITLRDARIDKSVDFLEFDERMALKKGNDTIHKAFDAAIKQLLLGHEFEPSEIQPYKSLEDIRDESILFDKAVKCVAEEFLKYSNTRCKFFSLRLVLISADKVFEEIVTSPLFRWRNRK